MRKHDAINMMALYTQGGDDIWLQMLRECFSMCDINRLGKIRYQIQAGMDDLAKQKLNSKEMCDWFAYLNRSIEKTAKQILRKMHPSPLDTFVLGQQLENLEKHKMVKLKRDAALREFFIKSSY